MWAHDFNFTGEIKMSFGAFISARGCGCGMYVYLCVSVGVSVTSSKQSLAILPSPGSW